jgi:hypothetical protein
MPGREYVAGRYLIRFVPRSVEDILALDDGREDERAFEVVERVSEINQGFYDDFVSPVVRALSNDATAWGFWLLNPVRLEHLLFSDLNPAMFWVRALAGLVRENRRPAADNPFSKLQHQVSEQIVQSLDQYRELRDDLQERLFKSIYGSPWLARAVGLRPGAPGRDGKQRRTWEHDELAQLKRREVEAAVETGTLLDAWARILLYLRADDIADERPFNMVRRLIDELQPANVPTLPALQEALKRQALVLALDEERAIAALPKLAPERALAQRGLEAARAVLSARGELNARQRARFQRLNGIFGLGAGPPSNGARPS